MLPGDTGGGRRKGGPPDPASRQKASDPHEIMIELARPTEVDDQCRFRSSQTRLDSSTAKQTAGWVQDASAKLDAPGTVASFQWDAFVASPGRPLKTWA